MCCLKLFCINHVSGSSRRAPIMSGLQWKVGHSPTNSILPLAFFFSFGGSVTRAGVFKPPGKKTSCRILSTWEKGQFYQAGIAVTIHCIINIEKYRKVMIPTCIYTFKPTCTNIFQLSGSSFVLGALFDEGRFFRRHFAWHSAGESANRRSQRIQQKWRAPKVKHAPTLGLSDLLATPQLFNQFFLTHFNTTTPRTRRPSSLLWLLRPRWIKVHTKKNMKEPGSVRRSKMFQNVNSIQIPQKLRDIVIGHQALIQISASSFWSKAWSAPACFLNCSWSENLLDWRLITLKRERPDMTRLRDLCTYNWKEFDIWIYTNLLLCPLVQILTSIIIHQISAVCCLCSSRKHQQLVAVAE